jgi:predicted glycosyltransferase
MEERGVKIGIFAITPAQIHFFKNVVTELRSAGHETFLMIRDYGESLQLAKELGIDHYVFSSSPESKLGKLAIFPLEILRSIAYLRSKGVEVVTGFGLYEAISSAGLRCPSITFTDSEYNCNRLSFSLQFWLSEMFMDHIITPEKYSQDLGPKQIRVNSYKELAYLHPNYYQPDPSIYGELGIDPGEPYVILRFNAFDAVHDMGISGSGGDIAAPDVRPVGHARRGQAPHRLPGRPLGSTHGADQGITRVVGSVPGASEIDVPTRNRLPPPPAK